MSFKLQKRGGQLQLSVKQIRTPSLHFVTMGPAVGLHYPTLGRADTGNVKTAQGSIAGFAAQAPPNPQTEPCDTPLNARIS